MNVALQVSFVAADFRPPICIVELQDAVTVEPPAPSRRAGEKAE